MTNAPAVRVDVDQPLGLEAEQGIAHGEPAHAEPLGELLLPEGLAGRGTRRGGSRRGGYRRSGPGWWLAPERGIVVDWHDMYTC